MACSTTSTVSTFVRSTCTRHSLTARGGPVDEGTVGGGTGMVCHEFKGGIGTASRVIDEAAGGYTVGVLVQANYGKRDWLRIDGVRVGEAIPTKRCRARTTRWRERSRRRRAPARSSWSSRRTPRSSPTSASGWPSEQVSASPASAAPAGTRAATCSSPLPPATGSPANVHDEHPIGLGTYDVRAVGDIVIDRLFDASIEATEEAIVNALVAATTVVGRDGNTAHALPHDRLREVMTANGR